jgi:hypothetical protein
MGYVAATAAFRARRLAGPQRDRWRVVFIAAFGAAG